MSAFWPFRHRVRAEWRDLDAAGHVNHAVYLTYMESARMAAYFAMTGGHDVKDLDIILARATVDYRAPASLLESIVIEVTPTRVGETSFTFRYVLREEVSGRLLAEAETVQVAYDYEKQAKKPLSPELRAKLAV